MLAAGADGGPERRAGGQHQQLQELRSVPLAAEPPDQAGEERSVLPKPPQPEPQHPHQRQRAASQPVSGAGERPEAPDAGGAERSAGGVGRQVHCQPEQRGAAAGPQLLGRAQHGPAPVDEAVPQPVQDHAHPGRQQPQVCQLQALEPHSDCVPLPVLLPAGAERGQRGAVRHRGARRHPGGGAGGLCGERGHRQAGDRRSHVGLVQKLEAPEAAAGLQVQVQHEQDRLEPVCAGAGRQLARDGSGHCQCGVAGLAEHQRPRRADRLVHLALVRQAAARGDPQCRGRRRVGLVQLRRHLGAPLHRRCLHRLDSQAHQREPVLHLQRGEAGAHQRQTTGEQAGVGPRAGQGPADRAAPVGNAAGRPHLLALHQHQDAPLRQGVQPQAGAQVRQRGAGGAAGCALRPVRQADTDDRAHQPQVLPELAVRVPASAERADPQGVPDVHQRLVRGGALAAL